MTSGTHARTDGNEPEPASSATDTGGPTAISTARSTATSTSTSAGTGSAPPVDMLSVLGRTVRHPIEHVECFARPDGCTAVRFSTDEVSSICPVTGQPDLSSVVIDYVPDRLCVESKSLKLYLWSFRDRPVFAEALAAEIGTEIRSSAEPHWVRVVITQRPRGGIELRTESESGRRPDQSGR